MCKVNKLNIPQKETSETAHSKETVCTRQEERRHGMQQEKEERESAQTKDTICQETKKMSVQQRRAKVHRKTIEHAKTEKKTKSTNREENMCRST